MVKGTDNTVERREITIFFKKQTSSVKDMENAEVKKIDVSLQSTMVLLGAISSELRTKSYTDYQTIAPAEMREVCNR